MDVSYDYEDPDTVNDEYDYGDLNDEHRPPAEEEVKIRNKYISSRRGSIAADLGDDDDMREELDRLTMA